MVDDLGHEISNGSSLRREKVAILGGGMAALTAAFELAKQRQADGSPKYDITIYQQGWRLGGKGASGRNDGDDQRIEEHGLHIWFGAYDNAFATMRDVYGRQPSKWPHGDLNQAFHQQCGFHLWDIFEDKCEPWWWFGLPTTAALPGGRVAKALLPRLMIRAVQDWLPGYFAASTLYKEYLQQFDKMHIEHLDDNDPPLTPDYLRSLAMHALDDDITLKKLKELADRYQAFVAKLWCQLGLLLNSRVHDDLCAYRRTADVITVAAAVIAGGLVDVFLSNDWDVINNEDLRDWLKKWTLNYGVIERSALVKVSYSLFFSFSRGDTQAKGTMEAGTAVRAALWLLLNYKGAIMWRMNAGMGDTIFAPLYNALKNDPFNVKFKFFHKVLSLHLAADNTVSRIVVERQATVKAGDVNYAPFVQDPLGIDCWPSRPLFKLLEEGDELSSGWDDFNLESDWSTWKKVSRLQLHAGPDNDFEKVILGIPIAALQDICTELTQSSLGGPLLAMIQNVQTVQTQAFQVWLTKPLQALDSPLERPGVLPIMTTFMDPVDTYADMSYLLDHESWRTENPPKHLAYFCGVLEDEISLLPPSAEPHFPIRKARQVERLAKTMLAKDLRAVWRNAYPGGNFDWRLVKALFRRANVDKSERYVLALPTTSQFRVAAAKSGFGNLFFAGDWIYNGVFVGCIEGAVIAGMQAARAVSGAPIKIAGEDEWFKRP